MPNTPSAEEFLRLAGTRELSTNELQLVDDYIAANRNNATAINVYDSSGCTPLIKAIVASNILLIRKLINLPSCDINAFCIGQTAIMTAAAYSLPEVVEVLLQAPNINLTLKNISGRTAAGIALLFFHPNNHELLRTHQTNHISDAQEFIQAAKDGDSDFVREYIYGNGRTATAMNVIDTTNDAGFTALMYAVQNGHQSIIDMLLVAPGVNVNARSKFGLTALMVAQDIVTVRKLLNAPGIDVNAVTIDNEGLYRDNALSIAVIGNHVEVVRALLAVPGIEYRIQSGPMQTNYHYLIEENANEAARLVNAARQHALATHTTRSTINDFLQAAAEDKSAEVKNYLETSEANRSNVNATNADGFTALMLTAIGGHVATAEVLLATPGIEIDKKNSAGNTALILAAATNHEKIVELLLKHHANPDITNDNGRTAILEASRRKFSNIVKLFNADVSTPTPASATNTELQTLTDLQFLEAARTNDLASVKMYVRANKNNKTLMNVVDENDNNALMLAVYHGHTAIVNELIAPGLIDLNARNKSNQAAEDIAEAAQHRSYGNPTLQDTYASIATLITQLKNFDPNAHKGASSPSSSSSSQSTQKNDADLPPSLTIEINLVDLQNQPEDLKKHSFYKNILLQFELEAKKQNSNTLPEKAMVTIEYNDLLCPFDFELIKDPILLSSGTICDRDNLKSYFQNYNKTADTDTLLDPKLQRRIMKSEENNPKLNFFLTIISKYLSAADDLKKPKQSVNHLFFTDKNRSDKGNDPDSGVSHKTTSLTLKK